MNPVINPKMNHAMIHILPTRLETSLDVHSFRGGSYRPRSGRPDEFDAAMITASTTRPHRCMPSSLAATPNLFRRGPVVDRMIDAPRFDEPIDSMTLGYTRTWKQ
jgi:hypothetical protein